VCLSGDDTASPGDPPASADGRNGDTTEGTSRNPWDPDGNLLEFIVY